MRTVLLALVGLLLWVPFGAPTAHAQASCPPKLEITHGDGTKTCLTDTALALVKPGSWGVPLASAIPANLRYSIALPRDPAQCPAALGFAATSSTSFLTMGTESEQRDATALSECRRLVRAARPASGRDCGCDLVVSGGRSTLAARTFDERATATAVRLLGMGTVTTDVAAAQRAASAPQETVLAAAAVTSPVPQPIAPAAASPRLPPAAPSAGRPEVGMPAGATVAQVPAPSATTPPQRLPSAGPASSPAGREPGPGPQTVATTSPGRISTPGRPAPSADAAGASAGPPSTAAAETRPAVASGAAPVQTANAGGAPAPASARPASPSPAPAAATPDAVQVVSSSGASAIVVSAAELAAIRQQLDALKAELARANEAAATRTVAESRKPALPRLKVRALVVGNGSYQGLTRLPNAPRDARAVAAKLRDFGIDVDLVVDATRQQMVAALTKYEMGSAQYDVNIFFYAGHGIQVAGSNYLAPVDMSTETMTVGSVKLNSVALVDVLEYMSAKTRLVFLDACRDNPVSRSLLATRSVAAVGLAPVSVASGTLISYATRDGSVAEDGSGVNSPYTTALLQHLDARDDIAVVLRRVRQSVLAATANRQEPWEYGSLIGDELVLSQIARR